MLKYALTTFGIKITGKITLQEDKVQLEGELPFAAMMFKGKIEQGIREQLGALLA